MNVANVGNVAGLQGQVVAHESVEVPPIGLLPEGDLHRSPVIAENLGLALVIEARVEDVVPELLAFRFAPAVRSLEDRDEELRSRPHEGEQLRLFGFHLFIRAGAG
jgi:hypothetical protein